MNATPIDRADMQRRLEQRCCWVANNPDIVQAAGEQGEQQWNLHRGKQAGAARSK